MKKIIAVITLFFIIVGSVYAEEQKKPVPNQSITLNKPNYSGRVLHWYFIFKGGFAGLGLEKIGPFSDQKSCNENRMWLYENSRGVPGRGVSNCWFVYE